MGETFEDPFMQEVQQLEQQWERRAPRRFVEECNTVSLTSEMDEPITINKVWQEDFIGQWKEATDAEYKSWISNET